MSVAFRYALSNPFFWKNSLILVRGLDMADKSDFLEQVAIPSELIENLIIPNSALTWLSVCKKYNTLAVKHAVDDPFLLADPQRAVYSATYYKNYALLSALLADRRYGATYILSQAFNACPEDKKANLIFLTNFLDREWLTSRILNRAVRANWLDMIDIIQKSDKINGLQFDSFANMSQEIFQRVIHHPKLRWVDKHISDLALNTHIPYNIKKELMLFPKIDLSAVLVKFKHIEFCMDALTEHPRVINSVELQLDLWEALTTYNTCQEVEYDRAELVKKILAQRLLDPSIHDNFPLKRFLLVYDFDLNIMSITKMLLDDDRVQFRLDPLSENVIYFVISAVSPDNLTKKILFLLNHPRCKKEWLEEVIKFMFDGQFEISTLFISNIEKIFSEHSLDEYLSQETRQRAPREIERLKSFHADFYALFQRPKL